MDLSFLDTPQEYAMSAATAAAQGDGVPACLDEQYLSGKPAGLEMPPGSNVSTAGLIRGVSLEICSTPGVAAPRGGRRNRLHRAKWPPRILIRCPPRVPS